MSRLGPKIAVLLLFLFLLFVSILIFPWSTINWGKIELSPTSTVTVTGEAETQEKNQTASFTASVSATNDDKEIAVDEVNEKINEIVDSVKNFGIDEMDIQTQNLYVNQRQEDFEDEGREKTRAGQWTASNTISIKLKNVERANDLANLLSESGATNVSGPNFRLEDTDEIEIDLLEDAIINAREKAEKIAISGGKELGEIVSVTEGTSISTAPRAVMFEGIGGGAALEPGSATVRKSVTVVFELK